MDERKILNVVVLVVSQDIEHHESESLVDLARVFGGHERRLEQIAVVHAWHAVRSFEHAPKRDHVFFDVPLAVKALDGEEILALSTNLGGNQAGGRHVDLGRLRHSSIGQLDPAHGRRIRVEGPEFHDPMVEVVGDGSKAGDALVPAFFDGDSDLWAGTAGRSAVDVEGRQNVIRRPFLNQQSAFGQTLQRHHGL